MLLRNQLYAGIVDVTEYGVRGKRGDFEPLITEDLFYRVQAVLSGRVPSTMPQQRTRTSHYAPWCDMSLWRWLHRHDADLEPGHLKWRFANATPEPDFK